MWRCIMADVKSFVLNLEVGQKILVGKDRSPAEITKIEWYERTGELHLRTTQGKRRALTFALPKD